MDLQSRRSREFAGVADALLAEIALSVVSCGSFLKILLDLRKDSVFFIVHIFQRLVLNSAVALNLQLLAHANCGTHVAKKSLLLADVQLKEVMALRELQELQRIGAFHLEQEVVSHELYFFVLSGELQTIRL